MGKPPNDRRGTELTPGERFKNWVSGVVQLWPIIIPLLGGSIYGGHKAVENYAASKEPPKVISAPTKPAPTTNHTAQFQQSIDSILAKLNELDVELAKLKAKDAEIDKMKVDLDKIKEVVQ